MVLFNLERMRASDEYNRYLEAGEVARLMHKYGYHVSLGDQDWFTNVGLEVGVLYNFVSIYGYKAVSTLVS